MSLKVWLPLDGDLRNLGTSNIEFTNENTSNIVIDTAGKIGKCYKRTAAKTTGRIIANKTINLNNDLSMCCWAKVTETVGSTANGLVSLHSHEHNTGFGLTVKQISTTDYRICCNTGNGSNRTYDSYYGTTNIKDNWHHLTLTYNNTIKQFKLWVDGNLEYTQNYTNASRDETLMLFEWSTTYNSVSYRPACSLNDVRIYDHCLSAAEVHEIVQGLILHYKLDGFMGGVGENLLMNSRTFGTGWSGVGTTTQNAYENNFAVKYYDYSSGTNNYADAVVYSNVTTVQPGETYTGSFWAKADTSSSLTCYFYNNTSGVVQVSSIKRSNGTTGSYSDGSSSFTIDNVWRKYWVTWTFGSSGTAALKTFIVCRLTKGSSGISIAKVKLEKGDKATEWVPHINELGINTTKIEDSSGYGHNGTITGNVTTSSSTPRYNVSTNFPDSACSIGIGNLSTMIPEGIFTFNIWFKKLTGEWSSKSYETILGGPSGFELEAKVSSTNSPVLKYYSWGGGTTNYTLDEWHMVTMVRTTANTQFYLDGELKVTGSGGSIPSGDYFIGAWKTATQQNYRGYLSDARIYCTPLLDNDIKLLYNVGMKVDNLGGVHTFELNEKDNNLLAGTMITASIGNRINPYTKYNSNGELYFDTNGSSAGSDYLPINPANHTYYYDFDISVNAGNQFYIGFERYDANKTSRSNNACNYIYASNSSTDINHKHIFGTVNLSTDGVNPCAFIALRILNGWSGTTSGVVGTATIHSMSLREISTIQNPKSYKNGILSTGEFKEYQKAALYKNGFIESTEFIEI